VLDPGPADGPGVEPVHDEQHVRARVLARVRLAPRGPGLDLVHEHVHARDRLYVRPHPRDEERLEVREQPRGRVPGLHQVHARVGARDQELVVGHHRDLEGRPRLVGPQRLPQLVHAPERDQLHELDLVPEHEPQQGEVLVAHRQDVRDPDHLRGQLHELVRHLGLGQGPEVAVAHAVVRELLHEGVRVHRLAHHVAGVVAHVVAHDHLLLHVHLQLHVLPVIIFIILYISVIPLVFGADDDDDDLVQVDDQARPQLRVLEEPHEHLRAALSIMMRITTGARAQDVAVDEADADEFADVIINMCRYIITTCYKCRITITSRIEMCGTIEGVELCMKPDIGRGINMNVGTIVIPFVKRKTKKGGDSIMRMDLRNIITTKVVSDGICDMCRGRDDDGGLISDFEEISPMNA